MEEVKRAVSICLPTGSFETYKEFLDEVTTLGDKVFDFNQELKHTKRVVFEYIPENDVRDVDYPDGKSAIVKTQTVPLPRVQVFHLFPKNFADKSELEGIMNPQHHALSEFVIGAYTATPHYVSGVYRENKLKPNGHFGMKTVLKVHNNT